MAPNAFSAVFETTKGPFTIRAVREWAPLGVDRLYRLLQDRYFDANAFFRVLRNDTAGTAFVAQWGVSGLPSANEAWASQQIANEDYGGTGVTPLSNTRGTISFAKEYLDDESTCCRTTELYVNYGNNSRLDAHGFQPVAYVVDGMATLDALAVTGEAVDWDTYLAQGNAYIEANFPWMDRITSTAIVLDADREEAVRAPDEFTVDVETTKGPFTFVAHRAWAENIEAKLVRLPNVAPPKTFSLFLSTVRAHFSYHIPAAPTNDRKGKSKVEPRSARAHICLIVHSHAWEALVAEHGEDAVIYIKGEMENPNGSGIPVAIEHVVTSEEREGVVEVTSPEVHEVAARNYMVRLGLYLDPEHTVRVGRHHQLCHATYDLDAVTRAQAANHRPISDQLFDT